MNNKLEAFRDAICGKTVSVVGLGISNTPVIDFLLSCGATVVGRDKKSAEALGTLAQTLADKGVSLRLGEDYLSDLCEDVIFKAPGIRPDLPEFLAAQERGCALTSEMEVFLALCPAPVFAVTGSDGKTTTTTLIYTLLKTQADKDGADKTVYVGGNIGKPLLPEIAEMTEDDTVVLELSSFQLQALKTGREMQSWPHAACITNVTPNHLNWHTDMEEYTDAKAEIFAHQARGDRLILNYENDLTRAMAKHAACHVTYFSSVHDLTDCLTDTAEYPADAVIFERDGQIVIAADAEEEPFALLDVADILLPGRHNVENYMTAIAAVRGYVDPDTIVEVAKTFGGVEHRQEFVCERGGVKYYNSSIDSSPTRTIAALHAFKQKLIVILGGADKGVPFDSLAKPLSEHAKAVILTGASRDKIAAALNNSAEFTASGVPVYNVPAFTDAIDAARDAADVGDIVILSPACTSFDAFPNFEVRGNTFKQHVLAY
ncbi:MAG: UDP-N-acetylmuramoyl-L-alanine--D-glutamate ligase [Clostridia bacterium]|nr:UDP-N-acetylmuramoyl-L-alanine--D-glutamate ligase [Clostridia bacterium]